MNKNKGIKIYFIQKEQNKKLEISFLKLYQKSYE